MAAVDRISDLPEPILHHILSFLSQKEAIQTSALSKPWRHVGLTRPKIELREICFEDSDRAGFLSVLDETLQRYYHHNLPVDEFILEMSSSKSESEDQLVDRDLENTIFKGLKRLSLTRVHIKAETLEKIMRSCPLIEYLQVSECAGFTTIPLTIFQAEFLTELHLTDISSRPRGHKLIFTAPTSTELILIKGLKTLSLGRVYIAEETLEKIMCSCPLIQRLLLPNCVGLTNIKLIKNNNNLKHFSGSFYRAKPKSFEIDAPTIETISIMSCLNWNGHDKYFFPRLKTLYLNNVKLSAKLFESFSSNFPSLEDLELRRCYGFSEIQLTVCRIKCLVIIIFGSFEPMVISIYAPNIHYFKLSTNFPSQLIFNTETTREWKSHVDLLFDRCFGDKDSMLTWLRQLSKLLNSLSESQISLDVSLNPFMNLKFEDPNDASFQPVPLEHVSVKGSYESSSFSDFLHCLLVICRPRYIGMDVVYNINTFTDLKKEKDKLAELIALKTIRNEGEMSRGYLWEQDLEEISMQVWDQNSQGWHTVGVEGTYFPGFITSYQRIRFSVKWRD